MPADLIARVPLTMPMDGSWLNEIDEELMLRGIWARISERAKSVGWYGRLDKTLLYDILTWRCWWDGGSICPAVVFVDDKAYLLVLDKNEEKFIKVLNLEDVVIEEIKGLIRYSECLEKYGYDFPC